MADQHAEAEARGINPYDPMPWAEQEARYRAARAGWFPPYGDEECLRPMGHGLHCHLEAGHWGDHDARTPDERDPQPAPEMDDDEVFDVVMGRGEVAPVLAGDATQWARSDETACGVRSVPGDDDDGQARFGYYYICSKLPGHVGQHVARMDHALVGEVVWYGPWADGSEFVEQCDEWLGHARVRCSQEVGHGGGHNNMRDVRVLRELDQHLLLALRDSKVGFIFDTEWDGWDDLYERIKDYAVELGVHIDALVRVHLDEFRNVGGVESFQADLFVEDGEPGTVTITETD